MTQKLNNSSFEDPEVSTLLTSGLDATQSHRLIEGLTRMEQVPVPEHAMQQLKHPGSGHMRSKRSVLLVMVPALAAFFMLAIMDSQGSFAKLQRKLNVASQIAEQYDLQNSETFQEEDFTPEIFDPELRVIEVVL